MFEPERDPMIQIHAQYRDLPVQALQRALAHCVRKHQ